MLSFISTLLILLNLILISRFKERFIIPSRFCTIDIYFCQKKVNSQEIYNNIQNLNLEVISKNIKEDGKNTQLKIISKIRKDTDIFKIKDDIKNMADIQKISVNESVKV